MTVWQRVTRLTLRRTSCASIATGKVPVQLRALRVSAGYCIGRDLLNRRNERNPTRFCKFPASWEGLNETAQWSGPDCWFARRVHAVIVDLQSDHLGPGRFSLGARHLAAPLTSARPQFLRLLSLCPYRRLLLLFRSLCLFSFQHACSHGPSLLTPSWCPSLQR